MVKAIFVNGNSRYNGKNITELPDSIEGVYNLSIAFLTIPDRDNFISKFPKSLKIRNQNISGHWEDGEYETFPIAGAYSQRPNKVTGIINEIGIKRIAKFYNEAKDFIK